MNEQGMTPPLRKRFAPPLALLGLWRNTSAGRSKDVFEKMYATGRAADDIVSAEGLTQIDDDAQIVALVQDVLTRNADAVAQYRSGKTNALGFLVGQVMKATAGKANPARVNELLKRALGT
jgi:aspartyl-tRNA(Asn)/glutamyl-tRNA(Gln) amidotransferase subunit B